MPSHRFPGTQADAPARRVTLLARGSLASWCWVWSKVEARFGGYRQIDAIPQIEDAGVRSDAWMALAGLDADRAQALWECHPGRIVLDARDALALCTSPSAATRHLGTLVMASVVDERPRGSVTGEGKAA